MGRIAEDLDDAAKRAEDAMARARDGQAPAEKAMRQALEALQQVGFSLDLPPFFMVTGINIAGSINVIGMRRSGMQRSDVDTVRWIYRTLQRSRLPMPARLDELRTRAGDPVVDEFIAFVASSKRGIVPGEGTVMRGSAMNQEA